MHFFHYIMLEKQTGEFKSANCSDYECLYTAIFLYSPAPSAATTSVQPLMMGQQAPLCQTQQNPLSPVLLVCETPQLGVS